MAPKLTSADIGNLGERYAENALQGQGWTCNRNTQLPGSTDIEAVSGTNRLLVQVKTAIFPNVAAVLSSDEQNSIVARAARTNCPAYLAQVQIDEYGRLHGEISWWKLN
jgi:hypothetical protein